MSDVEYTEVESGHGVGVIRSLLEQTLRVLPEGDG